MRRASRFLAREIVSGLVAPYTNAACDVSEAAHAAAYGAADAYRAHQQLRRGGRFGLDRGYVETSVGGEILHGVSDKKAALAILTAGFDSVVAELDGASPQMQAETRAIAAAWRQFAEGQASSMLIRWAADWSAYQDWHERLMDLRQILIAAGVPLATPAPAPLPKTVWQRGADGTGSKVDAAVYLARSGATLAMGLMGAWGLWAGLRSLRELRLLGV